MAFKRTDSLVDIAHAEGFNHGQRRFAIVRRSLSVPSCGQVIADPGCDVPPEFRWHEGAALSWLNGQAEGWRFSMLQHETLLADAGAVLDRIERAEARAS